MKTIITLLKQYRWNLLLILACSQIFILLLTIDDKQESANGIIIAMNSMLLVYTTIAFVPYVMLELRSQNYSLLPATTLRKYITTLASDSK